MEKKINVSFIVPVFNVERYLADCLDSIIAQSLTVIEIIIVNDGSTDNSLAIAEAYAATYAYIKIINKKNNGISAARNDGLKNSSGEYVCFIDSDDFYHCDFAKRFYEVSKEYDLDIIRGFYSIFDDEKNEYLPHEKPNITYKYKCIRGTEFLLKSVNEQANEVVPWLGFFRREYLIRNNLLFPEGIAYEEDQLFFLEALLCDENCKIMQTDIDFYSYRKRIGSATKTPTVKQAEDVLYIVEHENRILEKYNIAPAIKKVAQKYICSSFYQLTSIYGRVDINDRKKIVELVPFQIKWQCLVYPYNKHQFIKIFLFTFAPWLVDIVYKIKLNNKRGN